MRELTVNDIGHVGGGLRIVGLLITAASSLGGSGSGGGSSASDGDRRITCPVGTVPYVTPQLMTCVQAP